MGEKKDIHFVVLAHGLWGNAGHLDFIAEQLKEKYSGEIHLLNSRKNESEYTYDGIDICGERLIDEIQDEYETISKTSKVTKFSIIGYSLGGLFSRYVIGRLFKDGFFDKVKPVLFATFATPHLGVYRPYGTPLSAVFNWMSARILSRTGEQLQCCDEYRDGKPMLVVLSDPDYSFYRGLERFSKRRLYANVRADYSVPFWTGAISDVDSFTDLKSLEMTFDPTYTSLVQDFKPTTQLTAQHMTMVDLTRKISTYLLLTVAVPILVPLWLIIASSVLTVQGLSSRRRVGEILKSQSQNEPRSSRASVASSRRYSFNAAADEIILVPALDAVNTVSQEGPVHVTQIGNGEEVERQAVKPVVLDLKPAQRVMHTFLNRLEWEKRAVCIEGQLNSHGAIIVRTKRFDNEGGRAAVKHFVDNFEV